MKKNFLKTLIVVLFTLPIMLFSGCDFWLNRCQIQATANNAEYGTVCGTGEYYAKDEVVLEASANEGYEFINWTESGLEVSTSLVYTFTASQNRTLIANFSLIEIEPQNYIITATANNTEYGVVTGAGEYVENSEASIVATANEGYEFVNWTESDVEVSTTATYAFTVSGNRTLVANFIEEDPIYTSYAMSNNAVYGTVTGDGEYVSGSEVTLTATVNVGYEFVNWTESGVEIGTDLSYSYTVSGTRTIIANFRKIPPTVFTFSVAGNEVTTLADEEITLANFPVLNDEDGQVINGLYLDEDLTEEIVLPYSGEFSTIYVLLGDALTDLTYTLIDDGDAYSIKANNTLIIGAFEIASTYNGKPVTTIGELAFWNCNRMTSITIPTSITTISRMAFNGCYGLTGITIPSSVTYIGESAFFCCSGFTSVTIPSNVVQIPEHAFSACSGLTTVTISSGVTDIGAYAFTGCTNLLTITIPSTIIRVGAMAFNETSWYTTKANGLIYAGTVAYKYKGAMTSNTAITITSGTVGIADECFYSEPTTSTYLTSVTTRTTILYIGKSAFRNCANLTTLAIPSAITEIGEYAFYGCAKLTTITLPSTLTTIEDYTFRGCSLLSSLTVSSGIANIGEYAFYGCTALSTLSLPDSVESIGSCAFDNTAWYTNQSSGMVYANKVAYRYKGTMPADTTITITAGTKGIAGSAFCSYDENYISYCSELVTVNIPDSVTNIGEYAFSRSGISSIVIPSSITKINSYTFLVCTNLSSVTIPTSVTTIENGAFWCCYALESITLPSTLTKLGDSAFVGCTALTSIIIPDSTLEIGGGYGEGVFRGCTALTSVTLPSTLTSISQYMFEGCDALTTIVIPSTVTSIEQYAFANCQNLDTISLPAGVTYIGDYAFRRCRYLELTLNSAVPPELGSATFMLADYVKFYVPAEYLETYESDEIWGNIKDDIYPIP